MERGDFDASKADLDARVGQFARKCHKGVPGGSRIRICSGTCSFSVLLRVSHG